MKPFRNFDNSQDNHSIIVQAINKKQLMSFTYKGLERVVEPFTFGRFKNGSLLLVAYQVDGLSESGDIPSWRNFLIMDMHDVELEQHFFIGYREGYNPEDRRFVSIFAKIS